MSDLETNSRSILHLSGSALLDRIMEVRTARRNAIQNVAAKKAATQRKKKPAAVKAVAKMVQELDVDQIKLLLSQLED